MGSGDRKGKLFWLLQFGLGFLLIILLGVHLLVNHWAAPQGLLTYADVVRYYKAPGIAWMEAAFLAVVIAHCLLGLYSILLDLDPRPAINRIAAWLFVFIGLAAAAYGLWLIAVVAAQPLA